MDEGEGTTREPIKLQKKYAKLHEEKSTVILKQFIQVNDITNTR